MQTDDILRQVVDLVSGLMPQIEARRYDVAWKPDGSPVTQADVLVETSVGALLRSALPGVHVIGEEGYRDRDAAIDGDGWVAVLDPIDGTENFCSGLKEWGLALSLWQDRAHAGSLLYLPELGEQLMTGDTLPKRQSRIVGLSSSLGPEIIGTLGELQEARIVGCAVYNLLNVARGSFARFINPKGAYSWDLQAGLMLAAEHGCDILVDGRPYDGTLLQAGRRYRVDIRHRHDLHPGQGALG
ncbi:inositol monophosphatase family protein [Methylobrevis pamukkalensis]|uniref:Histidinol-phosphatase n=1 Tax=Methylobrevis pamukkalensis TaxID=1439726 RepID=A0A1E3GWW8_9HYPH|nr:inositol monophosphatase family protein [Methylobrevis pamukkalensis]ODN68558.1 Histidinol-phosphatase [Methylobrevis pamukkalensis]